MCNFLSPIWLRDFVTFLVFSLNCVNKQSYYQSIVYYIITSLWKWRWYKGLLTFDTWYVWSIYYQNKCRYDWSIGKVNVYMKNSA
jgi:hypothetical protein